MRHLVFTVFLAGLAGCAGVTSSSTFGPFPAASVGSGLTAGVAGFVPGSDQIPDENEFVLLLFNADEDTAYDVVVTEGTTTQISRRLTACGSALVVLSCLQPTITVTVEGTTATYTIQPDATPGNCVNVQLFITATAGTGTGTADTVTLSETPPTGSQCAGLGDLSGLLGGGLGG